MPSKTVAIQDACILIDLVNTEIFDHCLSLPYHFCTTDIIFDELHGWQQEIVRPHITAGSFKVLNIDAFDMSSILELSVNQRKLSTEDISAYYFAKKLDALLLTGDERLKKMARAENIPAVGILWIFNELVEQSVINKNAACNLLEKLMQKNRRLPPGPCDQLLKKWKAE